MSGSYFMLKFLKQIRRNMERKLKKEKEREESDRRTREETAAGELNTIKDEVDNDGRKALQARMEIKKSCRICLKQGVKPIFYSASTFDIPEAIELFGGIKINEHDDHPKYLCKECYGFLQNAVAFRTTAQESDKLFPPLQHHREQSLSVDGTDRNEESDSDELAQNSCICKLCKLNFKTAEELMTHRRSTAHKKLRIQCPVCYRLLTAQLYQKHLARHQSASHLVCDVCGKLYRKDNLARHMQLHTFDLPYKCQICPYRGRFVESLRIHMRTHTGEKPFSCDQCDKLRFVTRSNLNRHLLTHQKDRPFKCVECGRGFYTKRDMDVHFKSDHAGCKEFRCQICGNKYATKKAIMRHELRVHKRDKMAKGRMPLYLQPEYQTQDEGTEQNDDLSTG